MTPTRACGMVLVTATFILGLAADGVAQTNEEIFQQFQWNFANPGARANAMGQAFIGVADDASAAVTNPAGLVSLTRPQVYVEFKSTDLKTERLATRDSFTSLTTTTFGKTVSSVPFFDIAAPVGSRVAVAFTRHEFLNYEEEFQLDPRTNPISGNVFFPVDASVDLAGVSYAGSVGVALMDTFRVGFTVSLNTLDANTFTTRFRFTGTTAANATRSSIIVSDARLDDSDTSAAFSFGALFRPLDQFSVGLLYAKAPSFTVQEDFRFNPGDPTENLPLESFDTFPTDVVFNVPDRFGVGLAVRPQPRLLVSLDVVRVMYSNLAEELTPIAAFTTLTGSEFAIDDVTEVHFGGEVTVVRGANPLFLRAGVFTNPYHGLRFLGSSDLATDQSLGVLFNSGETDGTVLRSFGGGIAVGRRFQADVAYVWDRDFVVSAAIRF